MLRLNIKQRSSVLDLYLNQFLHEKNKYQKIAKKASKERIIISTSKGNKPKINHHFIDPSNSVNESEKTTTPQTVTTPSEEKNKNASHNVIILRIIVGIATGI